MVEIGKYGHSVADGHKTSLRLVRPDSGRFRNTDLGRGLGAQDVPEDVVNGSGVQYWSEPTTSPPRPRAQRLVHPEVDAQLEKISRPVAEEVDQAG